MADDQMAPGNPYSVGSNAYNSFNATYAANQQNLASPGSNPNGWYAGSSLGGNQASFKDGAWTQSSNGLTPGVFNAAGYYGSLAGSTPQTGYNADGTLAPPPAANTTIPSAPGGSRADTSLRNGLGDTGVDFTGGNSNWRNTGGDSPRWFNNSPIVSVDPSITPTRPRRPGPLSQITNDPRQYHDTTGINTGITTGLAGSGVSTGAGTGTSTGTVTAVGTGLTGAAPRFSVLTPGAPNTGYGMSLVNGMSQPTLAPEAMTYLDRMVQTAQSPYVLYSIATGNSTPQQEAQNIRDNMAAWAAMNPQLASGSNWQDATDKAVAQFQTWLNSQPASSSLQGAPANSLGNGQRLGYGTSVQGPGYNGSQDPNVMNAPASWFPTMAKNPTGIPQPGNGLQQGQPAAPFNYGNPNTGGSLAPPPGTYQNPSLTTINNGSQIQSGLGGYGVQSTPLGYTQYYPTGQSPITAQQLIAMLGGSSGNIDSATLALIAQLIGGHSTGSTNYWNM